MNHVTKTINSDVLVNDPHTAIYCFPPGNLKRTPHPEHMGEDNRPDYTDNHVAMLVYDHVLAIPWDREVHRPHNIPMCKIRAVDEREVPPKARRRSRHLGEVGLLVPLRSCDHPEKDVEQYPLHAVHRQADGKVDLELDHEGGYNGAKHGCPLEGCLLSLHCVTLRLTALHCV